MRRITPEEVVEAYRKTGAKPCPNVYLVFTDNECLACGLGAVLLAEREQEAIAAVREGGGSLPMIWDMVGAAYEEGFSGGFDPRPFPAPEGPGERIQQGYEDGRAAWEAVVAAGLVEGAA